METRRLARPEGFRFALVAAHRTGLGAGARFECRTVAFAFFPWLLFEGAFRLGPRAFRKFPAPTIFTLWSLAEARWG
jgi:hypothetical protein